MELVRSAHHDGVVLTAGGVAEFRAELVLQRGEFFHSVVGHGDQGPGDALIVVVHAFDREIVVPRTLAAYGRAGAGSQAAARSHTGLKQGEIQHSEPDGGDRRIGGRLFVEGALNLRGGRVDRRWRAGNFDGSDLLPNLQHQGGGLRLV